MTEEDNSPVWMHHGRAALQSHLLPLRVQYMYLLCTYPLEALKS